MHHTGFNIHVALHYEKVIAYSVVFKIKEDSLESMDLVSLYTAIYTPQEAHAVVMIYDEF